MVRAHFGSGKIQVWCVSGSDKIRATVLRDCKFRVDPIGLEHFFVTYFSFIKIKKETYLLLKNCLYLMKKHFNCNFLKEHEKYSNFSLKYERHTK